MNNKELEEIIRLLKENNKILKNIEKELSVIKTSSDKMDNHIDEIMNIYDIYKKPLNYLTDKFNSGLGLLKLTNN